MLQTNPNPPASATPGYGDILIYFFSGAPRINKDSPLAPLKKPIHFSKASFAGHLPSALCHLRLTPNPVRNPMRRRPGLAQPTPATSIPFCSLLSLLPHRLPLRCNPGEVQVGLALKGNPADSSSRPRLSATRACKSSSSRHRYGQATPESCVCLPHVVARGSRRNGEKY